MPELKPDDDDDDDNDKMLIEPQLKPPAPQRHLLAIGKN
jgi:hypothetical protein